MYKKIKNKTKNIGHWSNACLRKLCIMVLLCVAYTSYAGTYVQVKPLVYERVGAESILQCVYNTGAATTDETTLEFSKWIATTKSVMHTNRRGTLVYGTGYNKEKVQFKNPYPQKNPYPKTSTAPPLVDEVYMSASFTIKNLLLSDTYTYRCRVSIDNTGGGDDDKYMQLVVFPAAGSITLSEDGKTLVTTRSSKNEYLEVFVQNASGTWDSQKRVQLESEFYGAGRDISMSLTKDGTMLVAGSPVRSATSTSRAGITHVVLLNEVEKK